MSTSPVTFNGSSTFSSSFQQVITRAVGIASLPIQILQSDVSKLTSQQTTTSQLGANFQAVQATIQALDQAVAGSPTAQVTGGSGVNATATAAALPGTYTIQVDDVGSSTLTLSKAGVTPVADPSSENISTASSFTLTVNGIAKTITPSGNSLQSLVSAINSSGDGVQATIVNVGSNTSPDYRLSATSDHLGADTIQLNDGSTNLLDTLSTGTNALYKINGSATDVQSTSGQITLSPGLTVNLLAQTTTPATITVSRSFAALQSGLSNFVSAYNAAVTALQLNEGQNGGALSGDSMVYTLTNALNGMAQYTTGSGSVSTFSSLGISLQQNGQLAFDPTAFSSANSADIQQFLGSISSSSGFLQTTNSALNSITDPTNGLIADGFNSIQSQIAAKNALIANDQLRVAALQTNLQAQLAHADAAIATLEAQKTYFMDLFTATYGNGTNSGH
jgi:flagellar hook-associated protein 2